MTLWPLIRVFIQISQKTAVLQMSIKLTKLRHQHHRRSLHYCNPFLSNYIHECLTVNGSQISCLLEHENFSSFTDLIFSLKSHHYHTETSMATCLKITYKYRNVPSAVFVDHNPAFYLHYFITGKKNHKNSMNRNCCSKNPPSPKN